MLKKSLVLGMTLALSASIFAGCGSNTNSGNNAQGSTDKGSTSTSTSNDPQKLVVGFIPSVNADTLEADAKPLEGLLQKQLGMPVTVVVTTNYSALVEAMAAKKVDVGFLSPVDYVFAHDKKHAAELLLQTVRNGSPTYRAEFVKKASNTSINSVKDVKGKKVAFVSATSAAGYLYPKAMLKDQGINADSDVMGTFAGANDKALEALYRGDVEVACAFEDARDQLVKDHPDVKTALTPFAYSDPIPNDTVSARPGLSKDLKDKITQAFIDIMKTPEGKQIGKKTYQFDNLVPGDDKNFDPVRKMISNVNVQESK